MSLCLTWAHLGIAGLAFDVAGAVVLALSFSTKKPEAIRSEVPENIPLFPGELAFPEALAHSMIRQRAEARLGLALLVAGFLLQAANPLFDLGSLTTAGQRVVALGSGASTRGAQAVGQGRYACLGVPVMRLGRVWRAAGAVWSAAGGLVGGQRRPRAVRGLSGRGMTGAQDTVLRSEYVLELRAQTSCRVLVCSSPGDCEAGLLPMPCRATSTRPVGNPGGRKGNRLSGHRFPFRSGRRSCGFWSSPTIAERTAVCVCSGAA